MFAFDFFSGAGQFIVHDTLEDVDMFHCLLPPDIIFCAVYRLARGNIRIGFS